jgi:hypothetical protein
LNLPQQLPCRFHQCQGKADGRRVAKSWKSLQQAAANSSSNYNNNNNSATSKELKVNHFSSHH